MRTQIGKETYLKLDSFQCQALLAGFIRALREVGIEPGGSEIAMFRELESSDGERRHPRFHPLIKRSIETQSYDVGFELGPRFRSHDLLQCEVLRESSSRHHLDRGLRHVVEIDLEDRNLGLIERRFNCRRQRVGVPLESMNRSQQVDRGLAVLHLPHKGLVRRIVVQGIREDRQG